jgi:hypothetical protein
MGASMLGSSLEDGVYGRLDSQARLLSTAQPRGLRFAHDSLLEGDGCELSVPSDLAPVSRLRLFCRPKGSAPSAERETERSGPSDDRA